MGSTVDRYYLFRKICEYPDAFACISPEIDKIAAVLVTKISSKITTLPAAREFYRALGADGFAVILGSLSDSALKTKLNKLDKHNLQQKGADAAWRRDHIQALAAGKINPAPDLASVLRLFKSKLVDLGGVRQVYDNRGSGTFESVMDVLTDKQIQALLVRLDKNNPEVKNSTAPWKRSHLRALAARQVDPVSQRETPQGETNRLHSESMAAVRRRK